MNQEIYQDELLSKPKVVKHLSVHPAISMSIDEMIEIIIKAGYEVRRNEYLDSG
jgi:c-di-GMP-related signal transduction protein